MLLGRIANRGRERAMRMIDLSRELYHRTPTYPGQPPIIHGVWKTHEESFVESGNVHGNCVMFFSMPDHGGTHIDAPRHFGKDGTPIDEYPLEYCYVKGICLDLRHIAPKAEITPSQLEEAVLKSGAAIPKRGTVLLCPGHHARPFPPPAYSTDNPGVNVAATEWLARQGIVHFGIDSMRPGPMGVVNSLVHKACLELDITHIESLCNLEALIGQGEFRFIGPPLKWRGGTGSPIRAVAVFEEGRGDAPSIRRRCRCLTLATPGSSVQSTNPWPGGACDGVVHHHPADGSHRRRGRRPRLHKADRHRRPRRPAPCLRRASRAGDARATLYAGSVRGGGAGLRRDSAARQAGAPRPRPPRRGLRVQRPD